MKTMPNRHLMHEPFTDCLNPSDHAAPYSLIGGVRPPDWRWREALGVLRNGGDCHYLRDRLVRQTIFYQRACAAMSSEDDLFKAFPGIYRAHHLWQAVGSLERWYLEALLLTSEPLEKVAQIMMRSPSDVDLYEKIFFNVRPYLNKKFYIYATVFKDLVAGDLGPDQTGLLLAHVAYHGGIEWLLSLMGQDRNAGESPDEYRKRSAKYWLQLRYWQAALMHGPASAHRRPLPAAAGRGEEMRSCKSDGGVAESQLENQNQHVRSLLEGIKISIKSAKDVPVKSAINQSEIEEVQQRLRGAVRNSSLASKREVAVDDD